MWDEAICIVTNDKSLKELDSFAITLVFVFNMYINESSHATEYMIMPLFEGGVYCFAPIGYSWSVSIQHLVQ